MLEAAGRQENGTTSLQNLGPLMAPLGSFMEAFPVGLPGGNLPIGATIWQPGAPLYNEGYCFAKCLK